jgi:enoyl-CoA hydratase/carnithine racemase
MELQREGDVFVLHMRDGENKVNRTFVDGVSAALDEVEAVEGEAALVTTGEGRFYSTGLDLGWLATCAPDVIEAFLADMHRLFARLLRSPVVTAAAINGHAFAAGAMLALAHDFRVMRADKGFVCLPEVDLMVRQPLTPGMYALLQAKLPPATLHEALLTGRRYGGPEARDAGLVTDAVAEGEVLPRAVAIAGGLAGKDHATVAALRSGLYASAIAILEGPLGEGVLPEGRL